jgi:polysaccharide biosynthesis transport protein
MMIENKPPLSPKDVSQSTRSRSEREHGEPPRPLEPVGQPMTAPLPGIPSPYLQGLLRKAHWWVIPLGVLMAGLGCALVLAFFKPMFEARFRMEVDDDQLLVSMQESPCTAEFVELQREILLGNKVLKKAVDDQAIATIPKIMTAKDPIGALRRGLNVTSAAGHHFIDVKFRDEDPEIAAAVVNTVVDEYMRTKHVAQQMRERICMAELTKAETEVEAAKQRVRDLSMQMVKTDTMIWETASGRISSAHLDELRTKRMELLSQLTIQQRKLAQARSAFEQEVGAEPMGSKPEVGTGLVSDEVLESDWVVVASRNQLSEAQQQWLESKSATNPSEDNPVYLHAKRTIEDLALYVENVRNSRRKELSERNQVATRDVRKEKLEALESIVEEIETKKETIEEQVGMFLVSLRQPYASSVDLQFAEADLEMWDDIRKKAHHRRVQQQIERKSGEVVREWERAIPPREPVEELPYKYLAAASVIGFSIPFLLLLGVYFEVRSRSTT